MTGLLRNEGPEQALWRAVAEAIGDSLEPSQPIESVTPVSGGDINRAARVRCGGQHYFVKLNLAERLPMFESEAAGLEDITQSDTLRCPQVVALGEGGGNAFLVLEHLALGGPRRPEALGEGLAAMHRATARRHGWTMDNFIGITLQPNDWCDDWGRFFRDQRLGHQLALAEVNGASARLLAQGNRLQEGLGAFFSDYQPVASLLHGDLWGGNHAYLASGEPVIYDPAVHYGDRECDLAMSELFGGFEPAFYDAYRNHWAPDPGYPVRRTLYQLYHVLNHFNLFGGGYAARAERMIDALLAELA